MLFQTNRSIRTFTPACVNLCERWSCTPAVFVYGISIWSHPALFFSIRSDLDPMQQSLIVDVHCQECLPVTYVCPHTFRQRLKMRLNLIQFNLSLSFPFLSFPPFSPICYKYKKSLYPYRVVGVDGSWASSMHVFVGLEKIYNCVPWGVLRVVMWNMGQ